MNGAERCLGELLSDLEQPAFDRVRVERARQELATSLSLLTPQTPRTEIERILVLHAMLRALVEHRQAETGRSLEAVIQARARCSRLTRPHDARTVVDLNA